VKPLPSPEEAERQLTLEEGIMRTALIVVGVLLMLVGAIWFFQGINVLPGSFMTGQAQWAVYGALAFIVGAFVFWRARRISRNP